ncbi:peptide chain release factor 1, partial [archaeon]|nr:peptide chain release factor 1 [archaeon]
EQLKRKVISVQDLSYTGSWGLKELVEKSADILSDEAIITERKIMAEFFRLLSQEANKVVYGETEVDKALEMGAVDKLLLSEALDDDMVERYEDKAEETGAEVILISTETSEGAQLKDIGRIAAILRFALN